jgi:hypothetical protein
MPSNLECYVYVVLPGSTEFLSAGRFSRAAIGKTNRWALSCTAGVFGDN